VTRICVSADYDASPQAVWAAVEYVDTHVDWMADAESIRFVTEQTEGVGTQFECVTRIGPFRVTDHMEITKWEPGRAMGVRHTGLVTGAGLFTITALGSGERSRFAWEEDLSFPWWLGGPLGSAVGGRTVMRRIWVGNLERLRPLVERRP
jgi:Polyketide cyclase / dehydrase and lipid transport